MDKFSTGFALFSVLGASIGLGLVTLAANAQRQQTTFTGNVERVWEDGFRLATGDRTLTVDTWNLCGDNTAQHLTTGQPLTVEGEFDGGEFDAFTLTDAEGAAICN